MENLDHIMRKILLVNSDDDLRLSLQDQLSLEGDFRVIGVASLFAAREKVKSGYFDIILLDAES